MNMRSQHLKLLTLVQCLQLISAMCIYFYITWYQNKNKASIISSETPIKSCLLWVGVISLIMLSATTPFPDEFFPGYWQE